MGRIKFLSWSWNGGLDAVALTTAIAAFQGGPVYATQVDDGGADYIVALSDVPLQPAEALAGWYGDDDRTMT